MPRKTLEDRALQIRAEAVRGLIAARELDPAVGLSFVISPPAAFAKASRRRAEDEAPDWQHAEETRRRGLELIAQGYSQGQVGRELGVARTTVQQWVARDRRERGLAPSDIERMPVGFREWHRANTVQ